MKPVRHVFIIESSDRVHNFLNIHRFVALAIFEDPKFSLSLLNSPFLRVVHQASHAGVILPLRLTSLQHGAVGRAFSPAESRCGWTSRAATSDTGGAAGCIGFDSVEGEPSATSPTSRPAATTSACPRSASNLPRGPRGLHVRP